MTTEAIILIVQLYNSSLREIAFEKNIFDGSSENLTYLLKSYLPEDLINIIKKGNELKKKI